MASAAVVAAGCGWGGRTPAAPAAPPPGTVYVSVPRLARLHPLWGEVERLGDAARTLGASAARPAAETSAAGGGRRPQGVYVLPPLPAGPQAAGAVDDAAVFARLRAEGRERIARFVRDLSVRQQAIVRRRREELEQAAERGEAANRAEETRLVETAAGIAVLEARVGDRQAVALAGSTAEAARAVLEQELRVLEADLAALRQQEVGNSAPLARAREVVRRALEDRKRLLNLVVQINALRENLRRIAPPLDAGLLEAEIERIRREGAVAGVSDYARLEARRRGREAELAALQAEIRRTTAALEPPPAADRDEARRRDRVAMERQLAVLRAELAGPVQEIARSERRALEAALRPGGPAAAAPPPANGRGAAAAAAVTLDAGGTAGEGLRPGAAGPGNAGDVSALAAARAKLERQREDLRRYLYADVADAVRDAADARRLRVVFDRPPGGSVPDRTDEFAVWTGRRRRDLR
jgi:hypothetical protein